MKRYIVLLFTALLALALTACAGNDAKGENTDLQSVQQASPANAETPMETPARQTAETVPADEPQTADTGKTLVVFFSATGTTKGVAERLASVTDATLFELVPAEPYTSADLNYNDSSTRATREQNDPSARPAISGTVENMADYDVIFLGYPIWWGQAPKIMYTFVESYDLAGKAIVPFCTSGSSDIGSSAVNLSKSAPDAVWMDGKRFSGGVSDADLRAWADAMQ